MKIPKGLIPIIILVILGGYLYWGVTDLANEKEAAINDLSSKGVVVNASVTERVKRISASKRNPFVYYYKIKYNEHNSGKVVERFVEECQENEYIGCLGKSAKTPLKMLYVTGDETMWADCSRIEDTSDTPNVDGKLHVCSISSYPPFTFDLERFKKK